MSSIMITSLLPTKKRLSQLLNSLQQRLQSFSDNLSEEIVLETVWIDFQQDVKFLSRMAISFAEALQDERLVVSKIEAFIKNLQLTNNELIDQQKQLMGRIQQVEKSKYEMSINFQNLIICKNRQAQETIKNQGQKMQQMKRFYEQQQSKSSQQMIQLKIEIENLIQTKKYLEQQLSLKQTEMQLAQLSIQDLFHQKTALQALANIQSPKKQNSCLYYESQPRKSTEPKSHRRQSSLLDDLVQSQILYEPYLSSQMFKSTETIQETTQDHNISSDKLAINSHIIIKEKRSKAIFVNIPEFKCSQICHTGVQTDTLDGFWTKWHKTFKQNIIDRRIKR